MKKGLAQLVSLTLLVLEALGVQTDSVLCRTEAGRIRVRTSFFEVTHPQKGGGGLPREVAFLHSGHVDKELFLFDRVYQRGTRRMYNLKDDPLATARVVEQTPTRVVVESRSRYVNGKGEPAPDGTRAVYRFEYCATSPVVRVSAEVTRDAAKAEPWTELHFLHLSHFKPAYRAFLLGPDAARVPFQAKGAAGGPSSGDDWALMASDTDAVGVGGGDVSCWDAAREFCYYTVLARGSMPKSETTRHFDGQLYFGPAGKDAAWYCRQFERLAKPPPAEGPKLETARSRLTFTDAASGFLCRSLEDKSTGVVFGRTRAKVPGLWRLQFRKGAAGEACELASRTVPPGRVETTVSGLRFVWEKLSLADEPGVVDVVCEVTRETAGDGFEFRIQVANRSKVYGLYETCYPYLERVSSAGAGDVAMPGGHWPTGNWGMALIRKNRQGKFASYPGSPMPMQFAAFLREGAGLYFAAHDDGATPKSFRLTPGQDVSFETLASDAGVPGKAGAPTFPVVVATFKGDWWQAAARYRAGATQQAWTRKGPIAARTDYPRRLVENGFWLNLSGTPEMVEKWANEAHARVAGRVPFGIHWYCWHEIPFDHTYPEYFPTKKGFAEAVARLKAKGILVMPYINGRLWDMDIPSFAAARPFATKDENGKPRIELYASRRRLVPMCVAEPYWGRKVNEICSRLMDECGVNGIYLDQIGAARPATCYDATHHHPLGGGRHWVDGYRTLLTPIKAKAAAQGVVLTTENTAEPYMDNIDAYLTWLTDQDTDIPALQAVYSGYTTWFGSWMDANNDLAGFRSCQMRETLWGCQIGWFGPWILEAAKRDQFECVVKLAALRVSKKEFFAEGRLLGEVANEVACPPFKTVWKVRGKSAPATLPSVYAFLWENPRGEMMLALGNVSDAPRTFRATVPGYAPVACDLASGEVRLLDLKSNEILTKLNYQMKVKSNAR